MKKVQILLLLISLLLIGCSDDAGQGGSLATPTPLPTPVIAEKPEYSVERGTVINLLEFTGRVSPVTEQELFFRSDGFVDSVFVSRGDTVAVGDVIAQLDISELEGQLQNAQLSLETSQTKLSEAEAQNTQDLAEAEIQLAEAEIAVLVAQENLDAAAVTNADEIAQAQLNLRDAQLSAETAQYNVGNAGTTQGDDLARVSAELERSRINLRSAELKLNDASTTLGDDLERARADLRNSQLSLEISEIDSSNAWTTNQDQLREATINLQNSQLDLQKELAKPRSSQLTQAEIDLNNANQRVIDAEREYAEVLDREWATEDEIKFYKDDLDAAQEQQRIANASYQEALATENARAQDLTRLQNAVALNQLAVEQAQRGVDPSKALTVEQQRIDVQLKQQALTQLERGIDPALALEVESARLDVQLKQNELTALQRGVDPNLARSAGQAQIQVQLQALNLQKLQRGVDPKLALELDKANLDLRKSELNLAKVQRGVDPLLALDVRSAELEIADIERKIADAQLIAPFAGDVLRIDIKPGDSAQGFDVVMVIAEPGLLEISADLTAEQLNDMSVGQAAAITLRNRPQDDLSGYIRQLPAGYSGSTVSGDDDSSVRVAFGAGPPIGGSASDGGDTGVITLEIPNLEIGELATVQIILEEKDGVLFVPPAAIRSFQGRDFVVVRNPDGTQQRIDVRIGIESDDRVEIEAGLEPGQTLIGE